jgi:DNA-binding CsgD family transcriptional regulator
MKNMVEGRLIRFTVREKEFCRYLVEGCKVRQIAGYMGITENTAGEYMKTLHVKTGVDGFSALVLFLAKHPELYAE